MSHEIEQMAYVGEVPWHGLGTELTQDSTIEEWTVQAGLDWEVIKRPVQFHRNDLTEPLNTYKDKFVLLRETDNKPYSIVSSRYKPVQPKQILEFFRDLVSDFGMSIETAGSLRDGQRVWALANTKDAYKVMGTDEVKGYLMLATSYDLTFSTLAQFTSIRVVCNNTLQQSFNNHSSRVKIPHFRDFNADAVKEELGVGRSQWSAFTKSLDLIAAMKLDVTKATEVLHTAFKVPNLDTNPTKEGEVAIGHCAKVIELFSGKAIGADVTGQTGWGLINAVTEYVDQHKRARNNSNRLDSAWFGEGFQIKQGVFNELLQLAA
jgi:phage/plasmid-like protein (TIGR03299 family)